ncbi:MarR family transcriptional regulator [Streptomyces sp. NPDC049879]|uniref:MarR family transcriptional regulator n=1 Tax=Streptomyces sp. NPDC049879 TaxID=3365598 RepID=UPI0037AC0245
MDTEKDRPPDGAALGAELSLRVVLFHQAVADRLGLNATEHKVLGLISRNPGISPGRLAAETRLSDAAVTKIAHRLVALGYVSRRRDAADGRRVRLAAGPAHGPSMGALMRPLAERMARVTGEFTEDELRTIGRWIDGTIGALRDATAALGEEEPRAQE